jgi:LacI family transcriptional regulator
MGIVDKRSRLQYNIGNDTGINTGTCEVTSPVGQKPSITIQDVAKAAGVSVSTVSRVLNEKDDVAEATYEKVQHTIEELGYTSSLAARSLRSHRTNTIGVIALNLNHSFAIQVLLGINRAIQELGYDLILYASGAKRKSTHAAWEQRHVSLINGSVADGVIIITPSAVTFPTTFPLVAIDPHSGDTDYPAVIATNRAGALEVMEYLIGLGHRRIGFISGREGLKSAQQRLRGYKESLQQANISLDPELIRQGDYRRKTGYHSAKGLLSLPNPPTAIFAANDESAIGAVEAAREAGLRIPYDLSVAGFDNIPEATYITPALTTVEQPMGKMAHTAAEMLINLIQGKNLDGRVHEVTTKLIVRDSCRAIT